MPVDVTPRTLGFGERLIRMLAVVLVSVSGPGGLAVAGTVVRNVTVIDGTGAPPRRGVHVLIDEGVIRAIGVDVPETNDHRLIDGTGKYLIPGLWDMHVHWNEIPGVLPRAEDYLPLFVANGVTGIRIMSGAPQHDEWRERFHDPALATPRILLGSNIIDGPKKVWPWSLAVETEDQARRSVRDFSERGADFLKIYDGLTSEAYFALADEAARLAMPFDGHVPIAVDAEDASDAGQRSFEHLTGVDLALSGERSEIRHEFLAAVSAVEASESFGDDTEPAFMAMQERIVDSYDPSRAPQLFERLVRNGTWQTPTLTVVRNVAFEPQMRAHSEERMRYLPAAMAGFWPDDDSEAAAERRRIAKRTFEHWRMIVGAMNEAGVRLLAGSDVMNPYCLPGFSLHDELALLVDAGLTPMEALETATRHPAEFSESLSVRGTIEVGKVADLVMLDESPVEDIRNTVHIAAVILDGHVFDRAALEAMLSRVREAAAASTP